MVDEPVADAKKMNSQHLCFFRGLGAALRGETDREPADLLGISASAVKMSRASAYLPGFSPNRLAGPTQ